MVVEPWRQHDTCISAWCIGASLNQQIQPQRDPFSKCIIPLLHSSILPLSLSSTPSYIHYVHQIDTHALYIYVYRQMDRDTLREKALTPGPLLDVPYQRVRGLDPPLFCSQGLTFLRSMIPNLRYVSVSQRFRTCYMYARKGSNSKSCYQQETNPNLVSVIET